MSARDVGGIACRMFALYLGFIGFREVVLFLAQLSIYRLEVGRFGQDPLWMTLCQSLLTFVAAAICWVKSNSLWPSDNLLTPNPAMDRRAWTRVGVLILGAYFLLQALPVAFLVFAKWFFQNIAVPSVSAARADEDILAALMAILMIIYGSIGWPRGVRDETVEA